jgi:glycosyltransferase involved in cell wall biosynthesis
MTPDSLLNQTPEGTVVVLGMHRSGTSLAAEIVQRSGYHPPQDLLAPHPEDNPRGYFESSAVVKLNNQVFDTLGLDWKDPQTLPKGWQKRCLDTDVSDRIIDLIRAHFLQYPSLLLKDPRLSRLLPLWLPALREHGGSLRVIHVLRRTDAVIESLLRRYRTRGLSQASINSPEQIALLWLRYNEEARQHLSNEQSLCVSYESLLSQPAIQLQRIADHLGLPLLPPSEQKQLIQPRPVQSKPPRQAAGSLGLDTSAMLDHLYSLWTRPEAAFGHVPASEVGAEQFSESSRITVPESAQLTAGLAMTPPTPQIAAAAVLKHICGSVPRRPRAGEPSRWLYLTDEPSSAHAIYRVKNPLDALNRCGEYASWTTPEQITDDTPLPTSALIVHRCRWTPALHGLIFRARSRGVTVAFDIDDWLLDPCVVEQGWFRFALQHGHQRRDQWLEAIASYRRIALECDLIIVPTATLAAHACSLGKPVMLLPNGFSPENLALSDHWREQRANRDRNARFRLGYASGSPTHDADFATIMPPLQEAFARHPQLELTLIGHLGHDLIEQLPSKRVEIRPKVAHINLAYELARLDLNLAPLEANPFCDAKSPQKYFEAALVGVPSLVSANPVFREQVTHQHNGLLARSPDEWLHVLHAALQTGTAQALGNAANIHAREGFRTDVLVGRWLQEFGQAGFVRISKHI